MGNVCLAALAVILLSFSSPAFQRRSFYADITCEGCSSYTGLMVQVQDWNRNMVASAPVNSDGALEVTGLTEGTYHFTVKNLRGDVIHTEVLTVGRHSGRGRIQLPAQAQPERPGSGTVSVARLQHKVPKAAKKEYDRAHKKVKKQDYAAAIEHLKKAIEIDPEYMQAHNNLGSVYMQLEDPKAALAAFRRATELDPGAPGPQVNAAIALLAVKAYAESESAARRALDLDPADVKARYVLGLALYSQGAYTDETVHQLKAAIDTFPNARIALAAVYANTERRDAARQLLNGYLERGYEGKRKEVQAFLAKLQ